MSILNVLLRPDQLLVAVDTLALDALTGHPCEGAKLLLIPQHNVVLACRGSAQFFLKIYEISVQASFRAGFSLEQLSLQLGLVIDQLWPTYLEAADRAGIERSQLHTELVLGGWSVQSGEMVATAYAKNAGGRRAIVQPLLGGLASPGKPLSGRRDSFDLDDILQAGRLQAAYLNALSERPVAGGRLIVAVLRKEKITVRTLGPL
jgi:hypothetical protein